MGMSTPYTVAASGNYGPVPAGGGYVIISGISIGETAGSAGTITLREGTSGGKIIGRINLAANGSTSFVELPHIRCQGQLYIVVTGTLTGAVYFR